MGEGIEPWIFGGVALIGAGITAFYMSRLFFMTFQGKPRFNDGHNALEGPEQHPHESPLLMTVPMIVLALGSALLGRLLSIGDGFATWLEPVTGHVEHHEPVLPVPVLIAATLVLVALGVFLAWRQYWAASVPVVAPRGSVLTRAARRDLYQDPVNEASFYRPGTHLVRTLTYADTAVIDGAVTGLGEGAVGWGERLRKLQNGYLRSYSALMAVGVVLVLVVVLVTRI